MKKALIFLFAAFCCAVPVISAEKTELPVMYEKFKDQTPQELWMLGRMYYNGERSALIPVDQHQAYLWWKIAAEKGHSDAMNDLAGCYIQGTGVEKNAAEGLKWLKKAVERKNLRACSNLGLHYMEGDIVKRDPVEAARLWKIAADGGHPRALYNLGWCYAKGIGVKQNYEQAFKLWLQAAEKGDFEAPFICAGIYENNKDFASAFKWYLKAAERGHPEAKIIVGTFYMGGIGTAQNKVEGIKWWTDVAENEMSPYREKAYFMLAMFYRNPAEKEYCDHKKAHLMMKKAADAGMLPAIFMLGVSYYEGLYVEKDTEKGLAMIQQAADEGLDMANLYLEQLKSGK